MTILSTLLSSIYTRFLEREVEGTIRAMLKNYPSRQLFTDAAKFVVFNQIPGDYLEFGVFEGHAFARVYAELHSAWHEYRLLEELAGHEVELSYLTHKRFIAFDSFEGLPGSDEDDTPAHFRHKGTYSASMDRFLSSIRMQGVNALQVVTVPGWFDTTLTPTTKTNYNITRAALIFVDCDLYESASPVLEFVTSLIQDGTVMILDDYFRYKGHPARGIQRALDEWRRSHPEIGLQELARCSGNRIAFVCYRTRSDGNDRDGHHHAVCASR